MPGGWLPLCLILIICARDNEVFFYTCVCMPIVFYSDEWAPDVHEEKKRMIYFNFTRGRIFA